MIAGILCYAALCVLMTVFQRSFIYYPAKYSSTQVDQNARSANLERWTNSAGQPIGFMRRAPKQPAEGSILIAYGNASTATDSAHYADDIQSVAGMDVYILEYPGYEDRPGSPGQTAFFQAGEDALNSLPTNHPIYLLGESLGTGTISYLAGIFSDKVAGIVLISPFDRLASPAQYHYPILPVHLLLFDRFSSVDYLRNYHGKVAIAVDGADEIVPEKFGLRLYDSYSGPKKLWEFRNAGHCQISGSVSEFWNEVIGFWRGTR
ncbi:MAG TPA: alpha/beta hydrolase [Verrucomicrobiae bacterium]